MIALGAGAAAFAQPLDAPSERPGPTIRESQVDRVEWKEVWLNQQGACEPTGNHWIYTTNCVAETDPLTGAVIGTRFATYRFDANYPGPGPSEPDDAEYFPSVGMPVAEANEFRPSAMAIDPTTGDVYVVGHGPRTPGETNIDVHVVKYDKNLLLQWHEQFDGPQAGDDAGVDIAIDPRPEACTPARHVVVVGLSSRTGSWGATERDVFALALRAFDGSAAGDAAQGEWAGAPGLNDAGVRWLGREGLDRESIVLGAHTVVDLRGLGVLRAGRFTGASERGPGRDFVTLRYKE